MADEDEAVDGQRLDHGFEIAEIGVGVIVPPGVPTAFPAPARIERDHPPAVR
jgi:hypothetical protein